MSCFCFFVSFEWHKSFPSLCSKTRNILSLVVWELKVYVLISPYHFVCCMHLCWTRDYNQTYICFSWSSNRVFSSKNNVMILMLLTVQGDIVNGWFRLKNIKYFIPRVSIYVHFLFSISLKSSTCMPQKLLVHVCIP